MSLTPLQRDALQRQEERLEAERDAIDVQLVAVRAALNSVEPPPEGRRHEPDDADNRPAREPTYTTPRAADREKLDAVDIPFDEVVRTIATPFRISWQAAAIAYGADPEHVFPNAAALPLGQGIPDFGPDWFRGDKRSGRPAIFDELNAAGWIDRVEGGFRISRPDN